jgi:hypothetical protein
MVYIWLGSAGMEGWHMISLIIRIYKEGVPLRKSLIVLATCCLLFLLVTPTLADVNFNINGKAYQPTIQPRIEEGSTMVPVYLVGRILGAEINTSDENINIIKNGQTFTLTLDSAKASLNGETVNLPLAPRRENGEVMVPLRAIMDAFKVRVDWQGQTKTVVINYQEQRQGLNVDEMLVKSSEALAQYNTYKTKADMKQQIEVNNPKEPGKKEKIDMKMDMDMAVQNKPVLVYGKTRAQVALPEGAGDIGMEAMDSEMLLNEQGMYITMPGQGWVKMTIPGMDIKALMEQAGSQDPISSLKQLKEAGVIMSFGDDQQKNGHAYWVINATMGADSVSRLIQNVLKQVPLPQADNAEINKVLAQLFKNMKADIVYCVWINQENFLTDYMQLDSNIRINMQIPPEVTEQEETVTMDMAMKQNAFYEIYDLGVPFTVPDVSEAVDMNQILQQNN